MNASIKQNDNSVAVEDTNFGDVFELDGCLYVRTLDSAIEITHPAGWSFGRTMWLNRVRSATAPKFAANARVVLRGRLVVE